MDTHPSFSHSDPRASSQPGRGTPAAAPKRPFAKPRLERQGSVPRITGGSDIFGDRG